jgi:hypothetical protein
MTKLFDDLKAGLEDIDRFLGGETEGFKVALPAEVATVNAGNPGGGDSSAASGRRSRNQEIDQRLRLANRRISQ